MWCRYSAQTIGVEGAAFAEGAGGEVAVIILRGGHNRRFRPETAADILTSAARP